MSDANHLMSTIRAHESRPAERDPHAGWRQRRLVAANFDEQLATQLARSQVDLHELLVLLDRGCPPELAARILAPLDVSR
jgi:hypothetical protein